MPEIPAAVKTLEHDLREIFGSRVQSVVVYGIHAHDAARGAAAHAQTHGHEEPALVHTLTVVDSIGHEDLRACTARIGSWQDAGLATPLVLPAEEFARSLDAFPFEFSGILADHTVISGRNPFEGLRVDPGDLRRACEVQARSHLLHLRQGYMETKGRADALAVLVVRSADAWVSLLLNIVRLEGLAGFDRAAAARHVERALNLTSGVEDVVKLVGVKEISSAEALRLFPFYLDAAERLTKYVDQWREAKQ
jgi:hypothetical protein